MNIAILSGLGPFTIARGPDVVLQHVGSLQPAQPTLGLRRHKHIPRHRLAPLMAGHNESPSNERASLAESFSTRCLDGLLIIISLCKALPVRLSTTLAPTDNATPLGINSGLLGPVIN